MIASQFLWTSKSVDRLTKQHQTQRLSYKRASSTHYAGKSKNLRTVETSSRFHSEEETSRESQFALSGFDSGTSGRVLARVVRARGAVGCAVVIGLGMVRLLRFSRRDEEDDGLRATEDAAPAWGKATLDCLSAMDMLARRERCIERSATRSLQPDGEVSHSDLAYLAVTPGSQLSSSSSRFTMSEQVAAARVTDAAVQG